MLAGYQRLRKIKLDAPILGIGLMSGTSMDAVDSALVEIFPTGGPPVRLIAYREEPVPPQLRRRLLDCMHLERSSVELICQLNFETGELFARAAQSLIEEARVKTNKIAFIGSHGQTIYHIPVIDKKRGWITPSTLQIGDSCVIAEKTGLLTVGDFRVRDMAAGGIGAPLIPFVDAFLFAQKNRDVICQNIGGIANCTLVKKNGEILAFDSGPGNMVMDLLVRKRTPRKRYDKNGNLARKGIIIPALLKKALKHPYFKKRPPKATGHEDFGDAFVQWFLAQAESEPLENLVATACELTARSVVDAYRKFIFPASHPMETIVSGGGTENPFLMERLKMQCPELKWRIIDEYGIPSNAKEAAGFAVLAFATLCGIPANVPSVTGAKHPAILGKIIPGSCGNLGTVHRFQQ